MTANARVMRQKMCPCCGTQFDCAAGGCWCDDVSVTDSRRTALRENYADCLCPTCLRSVSDQSDLLMIQFLRWVAEGPRTYADVMEAWQTSCPRQSVWEDAQADGLVEIGAHAVTLTARGKATLGAASG
jgi:hypothetical protein